MTDLDPDTTVWHKPIHLSSGQDSAVVHTNEDCHYLQNGDHPIRGPKKYGLLGDLKHCERCAGKIQHHRENDRTLFNQLTESDPEDMGLSPIGER